MRNPPLSTRAQRKAWLRTHRELWKEKFPDHERIVLAMRADGLYSEKSNMKDRLGAVDILIEELRKE